MKAKEIQTEMITGVCDKQNLHVLIESLYGDKFSFSAIVTGENNSPIQISIAQYYQVVVEDPDDETKSMVA
jgi:phosphoribosylamine-glycine ligase